MNKKIVGAALGALAVSCASAYAGGPVTYLLNMTGDQVVGGGDAGASATGTITFDAAGSLISWELDYFNLSHDISGWGFGIGGAGAGGSLAIMGNDSLSSGSGMYDDSSSQTASNINFILGEGDGAFFVIRTTGFNGGAVRGQLGTEVPAPGAACLLGLAGIAATRRRR